jgi:hypothetical protein
VGPLFSEAIRTPRIAQIRELSDGGHFENLGLCEMVRAAAISWW